MIDIRALIKAHEAVRPHVYPDSLGIPTVGAGFNLRRADARALLEAQGADYDAVLAGTQDLTLEQIDALLQGDIYSCQADLRHLFPDFFSFPDAVQAALVDIRFNLGPNRFRGFRKALACVEAKDWKGAATNFQNSVWATQVKGRAVQDCDLMRNA